MEKSIVYYPINNTKLFISETVFLHSSEHMKSFCYRNVESGGKGVLKMVESGGLNI